MNAGDHSSESVWPEFDERCANLCWDCRYTCITSGEAACVVLQANDTHLLQHVRQPYIDLPHMVEAEHYIYHMHRCNTDRKARE